MAHTRLFSASNEAAGRRGFPQAIREACLVDVFESREPEDSGLLTGIKRYPAGIDVASTSRKPSQGADRSPAQTVAIDNEF